MSTGTVQIPVLFDMSGDTIVFGEDGVGDFVSSHLDFLLDMTTEANGISLNAADISSAILIGDQDDGDSIFYAGGTTGNIAVDNLCNRIANAITRGKLVHIPKSGDTSNSGIPMGGRSLLYNASGQIQDPGEYAIKYNTSIAPIGDEQMLGQAMARVASVHLVGHPLSSGIFSDASQTQTDLETASGQTFNSGGSAFYNALAVQLSKVLGGSKSSAPMNPSVTSSIPGGDLASQNFYINFDSLTNGDSYNAGGAGANATATVVDGTNASHPDPRVSGSLYLRTATNEWAQANIYYDNTTTRAISFWHHFPLTISQSGKSSLIGGIYAGDAVRCNIERRGQSTSDLKYIATNDANVQWWVDGVKQTTVANGRLEFAASATGWHHHYIDLGPVYTGTDITQVRLGSHKLIDTHSQFQGFGFFDDFRFFDERLTDARIINLSTGANGNVGGGTIVRQPLDASGVSVPALKSIYEQLMNVPGRSQIMQTRDISGVVDNSNVTLTGGFPFIAGDKLVMYLRPKIQFAAQTFAEQNTVLTGFPMIDTFAVPVYDIGRKSTHGGVAGFTRTYSESSSYNADMGFDKCFENSSEPWSSGPDKYAAAAPHDHIAGDTTTNVDGSTTLSGSWGQVDLGENTSINKFTVEAIGYANRKPDEYSLLGSLDGTNWTTIKYVTTALVGNVPATFILNEIHGPYRYYRLSIKSVDGGDATDKMLFMTGLLLYGAKNPSEMTQVAGVPTASAVTDISGLITNVTATAANIETAFPGNATIGNEAELNKWGWMGSANSDSLSLDTTDITDIRTIDLHIWKITITL